MRDNKWIERGKSSVQQINKMKRKKGKIESVRYGSNEGSNMPDHAIKFMSVLDPQGFQDAGYAGSDDHKKACQGIVEHLDVPLGEDWKLVAYSNDHLQMNVAVLQHASGQHIEPSAEMATGVANALVDANVFGGRPFPLSVACWPLNQHSQN